MWENTILGTEFTRNFYAGIGPLQLGVVLVSLMIMLLIILPKNQNDIYLYFRSRSKSTEDFKSLKMKMLILCSNCTRAALLGCMKLALEIFTFDLDMLSGILNMKLSQDFFLRIYICG